GEVPDAVFCQIAACTLVQRSLFPCIHCLKGTSFFPVRTVFHLAEYKVFAVPGDDVNLTRPASVVVLQDLISELFQIVPCRFLIISACPAPVLSSVLLRHFPALPVSDKVSDKRLSVYRRRTEPLQRLNMLL